MSHPFEIGALGEIAIRCADIASMSTFYEEILGLTHLSGDHRSGIIFYKIADGFAGHTTVLALFAADAPQRDVHPKSGTAPATGAGSSLHHIALSLTRADQDTAIDWFTKTGVTHRIEHFGWIGWRGVFLTDPEGNTVELVAYSDDFKD